MSRRWSEQETEYLRQKFKKVHVKKIAKKLNRSVGAVYQHAKVKGISDKRAWQDIKKRDEEIRKLHAKGWSASEMQQVVGIHLRTINVRINLMGLTPHGRNERYRLRVAEKTRKQCKAAGVSSLAEIRSREMKRVARRLGWPDHLSLRSVQILETLYQCGPMTRKQIAEAVGLPWRGSRNSLGNKRVPGQGYLAELQRAGLVVRLENAIIHKGKGNHQDLYMVGLEVQPCRQQIARSLSEK